MRRLEADSTNMPSRSFPLMSLEAVSATELSMIRIPILRLSTISFCRIVAWEFSLTTMPLPKFDEIVLVSTPPAAQVPIRAALPSVTWIPVPLLETVLPLMMAKEPPSTRIPSPAPSMVLPFISAVEAKPSAMPTVSPPMAAKSLISIVRPWTRIALESAGAVMEGGPLPVQRQVLFPLAYEDGLVAVARDLDGGVGPGGIDRILKRGTGAGAGDGDRHSTAGRPQQVVELRLGHRVEAQLGFAHRAFLDLFLGDRVLLDLRAGDRVLLDLLAGDGVVLDVLAVDAALAVHVPRRLRPDRPGVECGRRAGQGQGRNNGCCLDHDLIPLPSETPFGEA